MPAGCVSPAGVVMPSRHRNRCVRRDTRSPSVRPVGPCAPPWWGPARCPSETPCPGGHRREVHRNWCESKGSPRHTVVLRAPAAGRPRTSRRAVRRGVVRAAGATTQGCCPVLAPPRRGAKPARTPAGESGGRPHVVGASPTKPSRGRGGTIPAGDPESLKTTSRACRHHPQSGWPRRPDRGTLPSDRAPHDRAPRGSREKARPAWSGAMAGRVREGCRVSAPPSQATGDDGRLDPEPPSRTS